MALANLGEVSIKNYTKVTEYLYLGNMEGATTAVINELKLTCIISAIKNLQVFNHWKSWQNSIEWEHLSIIDHRHEKILPWFEKVNERIQKHRMQNGRVLVHCAAGISRSATLVLAYLMKHEEMTLRQAYLFLAAKRPQIRPNSGFFNQLMQYERQLYNGKNTVKWIPDVLLQSQRNLLEVEKSQPFQPSTKAAKSSSSSQPSKTYPKKVILANNVNASAVSQSADIANNAEIKITLVSVKQSSNSSPPESSRTRELKSRSEVGSRSPAEKCNVCQPMKMTIISSNLKQINTANSVESYQFAIAQPQLPTMANSTTIVNKATGTSKQAMQPDSHLQGSTKEVINLNPTLKIMPNTSISNYCCRKTSNLRSEYARNYAPSIQTFIK